MNICLFTEEEVRRPLAKRDERTQHIIKVLHKKEGDSFDAGIIGGKAGTARITRIVPKGEPGEGELSFEFTPESDGKPLYPLSLIVGFPRPIQLRRLLRDVAGLGVCAVHLTGTELGEKSYMESTLVEKGAAYNMLLDGTAQAASTHVPDLFMHKSLADCLEALALTEATSLITLDNVGSSTSLRDFLASQAAGGHDVATAADKAPVIAAIGSERGWTERERALLSSRGFTRCSMGCRILRTETAATVACSLILDAMGKLS
ncbi:MAG: RsmE family RNA methyltransferase [Treponema sp.]|nr:RsmE family RNA methyltransferase [Treponema sp.]